MRKLLAIGLSLLALTALGGAKESFVSILQEDHQYTHLVETSQIKTFGPFVGASLFTDLPERPFSKIASVHFIVGDRGDIFFDSIGNIGFQDTSEKNCQKSGYTRTSCSSGVPASFCPYDSTYFKECCDAKYKYNKNECSYPKTISGDSCGDKYMCYCDRSLYPETKCVSPMVAEGGESCVEDGVTYYKQCVCPSQYSQICGDQNQQGVGEGCTQNGVTYYTSCQCKSGYTMTCSDLGPVTPTDYCLLKGIKYYNNCKTCENKCTLASCPTGNICEYEDCSQKYCAIGCATNYKDVDNYWCNGAMRCWFK